MVDIEKFSNRNPQKPYILGTYLAGFYGLHWKFGGVKKKVWNGPKKVWNGWYRGIFNLNQSKCLQNYIISNLTAIYNKNKMFKITPFICGNKKNLAHIYDVNLLKKKLLYIFEFMNNYLLMYWVYWCYWVYELNIIEYMAANKSARIKYIF